MKLWKELEINYHRNLLDNTGEQVESIRKEFLKVSSYLENFKLSLVGERNGL